MMECSRFQELVTDYLDGTASPRVRAECASHRLICRDCRDLYESVRVTVRELNDFGTAQLPSPPGLNEQIILATRAGEILGCRGFDELIEQYFEGVILAPHYQGFQHHFLLCRKCRRLISGIEEAIGLCQEVREEEVEVPVDLPKRIIEATTGVVSRRNQSSRLNTRGIDGSRVAAAALIIAASGLLILSRFGSIGGMASHATLQADTIVNVGQARISRTSDVARDNLELLTREVNDLLDGPTEPHQQSEPGRSKGR